MHTEKHKLIHALYSLEGLGSKTLRIILGTYPNPQDTLKASSEQLRSLSILPKVISSIHALTKKGIETSWKEIDQTNTQISLYTDPSYPKLLKEIPDYPPLLYYKGNINLLNEHPAIAIVGTRKPTTYGKQVAHTLSQNLSHAGISIVSGLAFGLDSIAHKACLEAGGHTIAVLGNGLAENNISPRSHIPLAKAILHHNGLLLSEYPPYTQASAGTFPARNRIIAGCTLGTLVIEAAEKSGTLITARNALEYDREVFAIPGSIFSPSSEGANNLIKKGACAVTNVSDLLEEIGWEQSQDTSKNDQDTSSLSHEEQTILQTLSQEQLSANMIARQTGISLPKINTHLTILEMNGFIKEIGNGIFIKT